MASIPNYILTGISGTYLYETPRSYTLTVNITTKPAQLSPFPQGLKTKDLEAGMVVRLGNCQSIIYTLLEAPADGYVKALCTFPNHSKASPKARLIHLASLGCQLYKNGEWNQRNWLREVDSKASQSSPFPQGLKTKDLRPGMVVTNGRYDEYSPGPIYTILKSPIAGSVWLKVLMAYRGYEAVVKSVRLTAFGCQPRRDGTWAPNWFREVN